MKRLAILGLSLTIGFSTLARGFPKLMEDTTKLARIRDWVISVLPPDHTPYGTVSPVDKTFADWVHRTGALPPDFDAMPSIVSLPHPLILDEGRKNTPVKTLAQWQQKKAQLRKDLEYYIIGSIPPAPEKMESKILEEVKEGEVIRRIVELSFGPGNQAKMTIELMIPPGQGPFPVFMTQWNHREWAQIALRRGYIGCVYAAADIKDDTEAYTQIWWPQYDFSRLGRRLYGTSRVVDYLYQLPFVDKEKIALTGHSRNGKLSLMTAAFDERIKAVITSSAGTGGELPWRYCSYYYDVEDLALLTTSQPTWFHPRLRFFVGREHKLPIDQNSFMALVAPRGLMLSTAQNEHASNVWGMEQAYHTTLPVFQFLGKPENFTMRVRHSKHGVNAQDLEDYIDFFDYVFGRSSYKPVYKFFNTYKFENWKQQSGEAVDPTRYAVRDGRIQASSLTAWEQTKPHVLSQLRWLLGTEPPGVKNPGPMTMEKKGRGEDYVFGSFITRPTATSKMKIMPINPYFGFGDNLYGYVYYPADEKGNPIRKDLPVVVYLHEFDYSKGFGAMGWQHKIQWFFEKLTAKGYAVFAFDMAGFGTRLEEGIRFYDRYPNWSKMGKLLADVRSAVDALEKLEFIDGKRIYLMGYSLGAKVGLMSAALDTRVAGVFSVAGFAPWREVSLDAEGLQVYSHLHGLIPKLGFFVGHERRIPVDYPEIIASIAPRPVWIIAPELDRNHPVAAVRSALEEVGKVYRLYGASNMLTHVYVNDYNRFSAEMQQQLLDWLPQP